MEEQMFLDFNLNFNLRSPQSTKPTLIYSVITWKGKQFKISTNMKVYPNDWDKHKQLCKISNNQCKLTNKNNRIANEKIKETLLAFSNFKYFLCENEGIGNEDFYNTLKKFLNPNIKIKKTYKNMENATLTILKYIEKGAQSESSKKIYRGHINTFKKFLNESNIEDKWENITKKNIENYLEWCIRKHETWTTTNNKLDYIKNILKDIDEIDKIWDYNKSKIDNVKRIPCKLTNQQLHKLQLALNEEEIMTLYKLKTLNEEETEIRDIFILQALVGQRIGDMHKIFDGSISINDDDATITITQQKTRETATIPIFPLTKELLKKYEKGFQHIDTSQKKDQDKININIKNIASRAGLNEEQTYEQQYGYDVEKIKKKMCDRIHTHTARHSFITIMCLLGIPKEVVIIATGHTDTAMIDKVYLHLKEEDKKKITKESYRNLNSALFGGFNSTNSSNEISNDNNINNIDNSLPSNKNEIEEAKRILAFLGGDACEYLELNDIDKLNRLLYGKYEHKLIAMGIDFNIIKKIYNARGKSLKEKREALEELINNLKNQRFNNIQ